jgi:hypothetical protein
MHWPSAAPFDSAGAPGLNGLIGRPLGGAYQATPRSPHQPAHGPDQLAGVGSLEVADRDPEVAALALGDRSRDALGRARVELGDREGPVARLPELAAAADVEGLEAVFTVPVAVPARPASLDDLELDAVGAHRHNGEARLAADGSAQRRHDRREPARAHDPLVKWPAAAGARVRLVDLVQDLVAEREPHHDQDDQARQRAEDPSPEAVAVHLCRP